MMTKAELDEWCSKYFTVKQSRKSKIIIDKSVKVSEEIETPNKGDLTDSDREVEMTPEGNYNVKD